ncbi:Sodium/hydrogen exchanger family-domain-containing protein [Dunaliella salina]|nr:Sodium/hydrogen exchanger family-domain-containing protein [Dunaliella salina]|eukprot:KAF5830611.1 Sodium/hydrogen exchanger family-domain-containing protein [Dunaliella salina]
MEHDSLLAYTYVLSIGTLGITQMLELNGILACFFSGLFFSAGLNAKERTEELQLQETADLLAGNLFFLMLGAVLPWGVWFRELSWWRLSVLAVSVNLLKRLPVVLAACRALPNIMSWREALLAGWFGPIGAASFLYALELLRRIRDPHAAREAYLVVTWMVMISVFLHSTTGVPLTKWLARGMERDPSDPEERDDVFKTWDVQDWRSAIEPESSEPPRMRKDSRSQAPEAPLPPPGKLFIRVPSSPSPLLRLSQQQQMGQRPSGQDEEIHGAAQQVLDGPLSQAMGIESMTRQEARCYPPWLQRFKRWLAASTKLFHREPSSWITKRERRRWRQGQKSSCI